MRTLKKHPFVTWTCLAAACAAVVVVAFVISAQPAAAGPGGATPKKTQVDTPIITCGDATQVSIYIQVCAPDGTGATGLPAGFTVQWTTAEAFALGPNGLTGLQWADPDGIPDSGDEYQWDASLDDNSWPPTDGVLACGGSFSGNANLSRYNLLAGDCTTVNIGELLFDEGASTNCDEALECGTEYVFRAFGHATNKLLRSDFTADLRCSTLPCGGGEACTDTYGYWKTHGPEGCVTGNNSNEWPVTELMLGTVTYTDVQLCDILNTPAEGTNLALAHQLIAALLNVANGADGTDAAQAISDANSFLANNGGVYGSCPTGSAGATCRTERGGLTDALTDYNEGATGPGHCD